MFRETWDWLASHGYEFVRCTNTSFIGVVCWAERKGQVHPDAETQPQRIGINAAWLWSPLHPHPALFLWLLGFVGGATTPDYQLTSEGLSRIRTFVERYTTLLQERARALQLLDELTSHAA